MSVNDSDPSSGDRLVLGSRTWDIADYSVIGRWDDQVDADPDVDLTTHDQQRSISRRHAAIERTTNGVELRDLGSANGTAVDGRPVPAGEAVPLRDGSTIVIGDVVLVVHLGSTPTAAFGEPEVDEHSDARDALETVISARRPRPPQEPAQGPKRRRGWPAKTGGAGAPTVRWWRQHFPAG